MRVRNRIMLWVAGAGLLTSLVFSLVVFLVMRMQPLEVMDSQLGLAAAGMAEQLEDVQKLPPGERTKILLISSEHYWIKVYDRNQRLVYQSDLPKVVDLPLNPYEGEGAYTVSEHIPRHLIYLHQDDEDEVTFRVRVITEKIAGSPYLIQIARPMEDLEEQAFHRLAAIGIGLAVSTVFLLALSYFLAGRIVEPIAQINRLARRINENTLDKRIPTGTNHDEIDELAVCLNRMFDRLQFSFARQKQFLADSSHELKSPIAMLRLFFDEAVQNRDLPDGMKQQLASQGLNVLRMDRLVKTLLELSALEIKAALELEPIDIAELARSVATDFEPLIERENIRLETEMPNRLEVRGDKDKIRRALINIFDNAVKYTEEKGRIRFMVAEDEDHLRLALANTGPGIAKEDLPKVFDQFYRVDKSRSTKYGGAGLGLAIVREIVRLHRGTVSIDSVPGSWTRIDIILPRHHLP